MKRRDFIRTGVILAASGLVAGSGMARSLLPDERVVSILYTNDTHSRIDPFPSNAPQYAGLGGIARRAELVGRIRKTVDASLLLDAGDVFQGTPWFHLYGGSKELELMTKMGYDAMCLGNHEFDNGLDGFAEAASSLGFPVLCANYRVTGTPLAPFVRQFIVLDRAGVRFGIFGLGIRLQGLVEPDLYGDIRYGNPVAWADRLAVHLRETLGCDYVICLSHLGYRYDDDRMDDRKLASQVDGVDLIIGGHTHTFLDRPELVRTPSGEQTLVAQAGHSGIRLGRIDLHVNSMGVIRPVISRQHTVSS